MPRLYATHIAGAEFNYTCLGGDFYDFTLTLYRDCINGEAPFDDPIEVFIFLGDNNQLYKVLQIYKPLQTPQLQMNNLGACVARTPDICVQVGRYQWRMDMPARVGGYYIGWARCCRNKTIRNLYNPLERGITFITFIPGPEVAACNSQPKFRELPPVFLCNKQWLSFDHSAIDPDGDSLVYELVRPYDGLNIQGLGVDNTQLNPGANPPDVYLNNPRRIPASNPMGPPPYLTTPFNIGYSYLQPFGPGSTTILNPQTGFLQIYPTETGLFVVAIAVFEYRNGKLISESRRDFQFVVLNCQIQEAAPTIKHNLSGLTTQQDTIMVAGGEPFCYQLTIADGFNRRGLQGRGISSAFGNTLFSTPYASPANIFTASDSITTSICWQPSCKYIGQTIPLVYMAWDVADCANYNRVFDTVWVKITTPLPVELSLGTTFPINFSAHHDTIILKPDESPCIKFSLKRTSKTGKINQLLVKTSRLGTALTNIFIQNDSTLTGEFCYKPTCAAQGMVDYVILTGLAHNSCEEITTVQDTIYFQIIPPENPRPTLQLSLNNLVTSGDTVLLNPDSAFCAAILITDSLPASRLFTAIRVVSSTGESTNNTPMLYWTTQTPILWQGKACWKAPCGYTPATFYVIISLIDSSACSQDYVITDTLKVRLIPPILIKPVLTAQFGSIPAQNDTLLYRANQRNCFNLILTDIQPNYPGTLDLTVTAYTPSGVSIPVEIFTQKDSLNLHTTICWRPTCDFFQNYILLNIIGKKSFLCEPVSFVNDSIWIWVDELASRPPIISHHVTKPYILPNTVSVTVGEKFCYQIKVTDPDTVSLLTIEPIGESWDDDFSFGSNTFIEDTTLGNPLSVTVCLEPNCYAADKLISVRFCSTDTTNCSSQVQVCDTLQIQVGHCNISYVNVFTPNGDGINDFFQPTDLEGVENYSLFIFDRWGNLVFSGTNKPKWDGMYSGSIVAEGVYYYKVDYQFYSGIGKLLYGSKTGSVTVLR
ncbi:MAG: gliding motility-associated C-terminal domain-containing protein [Bacteroidia bacterium]|nr:gliding motility-associated C-terminal domain-containing protein [Bacteroidia bacterium]